jgi:hypothetical protein
MLWKVHNLIEAVFLMCQQLHEWLQLATGGFAFEEGLKGTESAAKFYIAHANLEGHGAATSHAKRFPDAAKGVGGTGPFISKQHSSHVLVCPSLNFTLFW